MVILTKKKLPPIIFILSVLFVTFESYSECLLYDTCMSYFAHILSFGIFSLICLLFILRQCIRRSCEG